VEVALDALPHFDPFVLDKFPIRGAEWTIWPDQPQTGAEYAIGHPLELSPFTWDYLGASCDGQILTITPHYDRSTWDEFFVDAKGVVVVHAFGGAFRKTLGVQPCLLKGICAVLDKLRGAVDDAALAAKLAQTCTILCGPGVEGPSAPPSREIVHGVARLFLAWKLGAWRSRPPRSAP
jgi:hypothetical protein